MGAMASQITSLTIVYSTVYSWADQSKNQSSASLALVRGIHRWPVNSTHKWPVTRNMFPFHDVTMMLPPMAHYSDIAWTSWRVKRPVTRQFVQQCIQNNNNRNTKTQHYWLCVRRIHRGPVDSLHTGPVMRTAFPCHGLSPVHTMTYACTYTTTSRYLIHTELILEGLIYSCRVLSWISLSTSDWVLQ